MTAAEPDALRLVPDEMVFAFQGWYLKHTGKRIFARNAAKAIQAVLAAAPVSPDSDLLKEAVGLLAASIDLMTDDYQDCASHRAKTRAFLSKVEERG